MTAPSERNVDDGGLAEHGHSSWLCLCLCLVVVGACILPLIPIWRAAVTGVAVVWLVSRPGRGHYRLFVLGVTLGGGAIYSVGLLLLSLSAPSQVFAGSVLFPHGLPVSLGANGALLFGQLALLIGLAIQNYKSAHVFPRAFLAICLAFGVWSALSGLWNAATFATDQPANILAGASTWVDWTIGAILSATIFGQSRRLPMRLEEILGLSALLIAAALLTQWAIGDYSYVLTTFDSSSVFARTRASYYYHATATQFIAFSIPVIAVLALSMPKRRLCLFALALCGLALLINGTRGISVAVVAGLALLATFLLTTRRTLNLVAPMLAVLVLCLATQIVYVKPAAPSIASASDFAQSNSARAELAVTGAARIAERPLFGFGPGYGEVVQRPDGTGPRRVPLSSHVLAIDLAVMGGIPALLAFAGMLGFAILSAAAVIRRDPRSEASLHSAGGIAALGTFALTSLFHPQEHTSIIPVALMLAGALAARAQGRSSFSVRQPVLPRRQRRVLAGGFSTLVLAFVGWLVLTSPTYVFPALEFAVRYGNELRTNAVRVYATNRPTSIMLDLTLRMVGVHPQVALLPDEPALLPERDAYIVWSPADEPRYPALRAFLGPALERSYFQWMSVALLPSWTLINNFQPTVQFIQVGPRLPSDRLAT